ncbi:MAG TPA: SDR family NAD(P)-dependent oxidoreductase [Pseudonocardia sp.]|jgi:NAD(P)-dependent dehydrogenase (short-subunit alcohol dehydrogenase family)|nr:SDR family NAD(P)-dependent oxidoreductase [Pseudonocardia sp.]
MTTRTALITGVSRPLGLGFAVARQLAELGYHVVLTARNVEQAEQLATQLRQDNLPVTALRLDLTDRASMDETVTHLARSFGHLDVLVNNASTFPDVDVLSVLDADLDVVRAALEVDVIGPWGLIQATLPLLRKAPAARVVNVSSIAALQITAGVDLSASLRSPAHSIAKHLLTVLTAKIADELRDTGILVNAVDPGEIASHPERGDEDNARPAADSARGVVWAATLDEDGPTGGLFRDGHLVT